MLQVTPTLAIEEREIDERFVRASGPGGQNVNKVATAVELRFDVPRSSLPDAVKTRLRLLAGARVTAAGVLLLDAREHRTQARNRKAARRRLADLIRRAARRPRPRRQTKPSKASRQRRKTEKIKRGSLKRARSARDRDE